MLDLNLFGVLIALCLDRCSISFISGLRYEIEVDFSSNSQFLCLQEETFERQKKLESEKQVLVTEVNSLQRNFNTEKSTCLCNWHQFVALDWTS